ncbi:MAG: hypothetical protein Q8O30_04515 [Candidatus Omnitrophota bacterium]|nr:hypothetical protein [Candidatus Omnitrophota bacterium]
MSLKMVMISYNEAIDAEVMEVLEKCATNNYSKILATFGRGTTSGIHLGNDVWPGRNNILYVACQDNQAKELLSNVQALRKSNIGKEGVKAFSWALDAIT